MEPKCRYMRRNMFQRVERALNRKPLVGISRGNVRVLRVRGVSRVGITKRSFFQWLEWSLKRIPIYPRVCRSERRRKTNPLFTHVRTIVLSIVLTNDSLITRWIYTQWVFTMNLQLRLPAMMYDFFLSFFFPFFFFTGHRHDRARIRT